MEHAKTGKTGTELTTLNDLESIFDEIDKDGINSQFEDLVKQLNTLAASPADNSLENIVKNSSLLLTKAFNNASEQLSKIRKQETDSFQTDAVDKVNNLLSNIAHINKEIKSADISNSPSLELLDQRNTMLDELSQYVDIQTSTKLVPVGAGRTVEELSVNLVSGDKTVNLINNDKYNQFSLTIDNTAQNPVSIQLKDSAGNLLKDTDGNSLVTNSDVTNGVFGGYLAILNDSGEYDARNAVAEDDTTIPPTPGSPAVAATTRGIGYYEKVLNQLATTFADMMNRANSTNPTTDPANPTVPNKPLFSADDGSGIITAANISISNEWNNATGSYITATKQEAAPGVDNSNLGDNILFMVDQFSKQQTFTTSPNDPVANTTLFTCSIDSFVSNISTTLGLDIETISRQDDTYNSTLSDIDTQRASISSVDVNEEGINMIMYNQALTASSRFMTTMDEAIDTIINKMGVH